MNLTTNDKKALQDAMNESRDHDRHEWVNADGRRMATITCPFCGTRTNAHLWSLAGSGKRCPGCYALHTYHPAATYKAMEEA